MITLTSRQSQVVFYKIPPYEAMYKNIPKPFEITSLMTIGHSLNLYYVKSLIISKTELYTFNNIY